MFVAVLDGDAVAVGGIGVFVTAGVSVAVAGGMMNVTGGEMNSVPFRFAIRLTTPTPMLLSPVDWPRISTSRHAAD